MNKLLVIGICFFSLSCSASESSGTITGLTWISGPLRLVRNVSVGTFAVQFSGFFERPDWDLYLSNYKIALKENGEFSILVPIDMNYFKAVFSARGPNGEREHEIVKVSLNHFFSEKNQTLKTRSWMEKESRNLSMNLGVGSTYLSYQQTDLPRVSETNLSTKIDFIYALDPGVSTLEAGLFSSLLSLNNSPLAGNGLLNWGADVRYGREFLFNEGTWAMYLFGGFYGLGTFGTDNVGYSGVYGPEVFPAVRYTFQNGSMIGGYAKYSPILSGFGFLNFENAHLSAGLNYYLKPFREGILRGIPLGVSLEASRLKMNVLRGDIVSTSYTASLNLLF